MQEERKKIYAERADRIFAVLYLLVGFGFIYTFSSTGFEKHLAVFTAFYAAVVYGYLFSKGRRPAAEGYFWAVIMLGIGIPYAFQSIMPVLQVPVLIVTAAYFTLAASGRFLDQGRTSQWVVFDLWNALVIVPFCNLCSQIVVLAGGERDEMDEETADEKKKRHHILGIVIGVAAAIPALVVILPLLSGADDGFAHLIENLTGYLTEHFRVNLVRILFSIPVSLYLFGMIYGGISGRHTDSIDREAMKKNGREMRIVPDVSVYTALGIICAVYLLFIVLQGSYLFSAFAGIRPEGFTYAEYARQGFFELCKIAAFNLVILLAAGLLSGTEKEKNRGLRFFNVLLSVLTIFLIATAASKMILYINIYGLTVKRVIVMVFMIWMLAVFVMEIIRQWVVFPMVRQSVMLGALLFMLLCVLPVEKGILSYNQWARAIGAIV